jgi:hypothetical protein
MSSLNAPNIEQDLQYVFAHFFRLSYFRFKFKKREREVDSNTKSPQKRLFFE